MKKTELNEMWEQMIVMMKSITSSQKINLGEGVVLGHLKISTEWISKPRGETN